MAVQNASLEFTENRHFPEKKSKLAGKAKLAAEKRRPCDTNTMNPMKMRENERKKVWIGTEKRRERRQNKNKTAFFFSSTISSFKVLYQTSEQKMQITVASLWCATNILLLKREEKSLNKKYKKITRKKLKREKKKEKAKKEVRRLFSS